MATFLVKSDPDEFSLQDLERDGTTIWDGVHSYAAINFIKAMKPGDTVYVYHSLTEKAIVGLAKVIEEPFLNTADPRFSWAVKIGYIQTFKNPLPLTAIKDAPECKDFGLVKQSRLSVMPVDPRIEAWLKTKLS